MWYPAEGFPDVGDGDPVGRLERGWVLGRGEVVKVRLGWRWEEVGFKCFSLPLWCAIAIALCVYDIRVLC